MTDLSLTMSVVRLVRRYRPIVLALGSLVLVGSLFWSASAIAHVDRKESLVTRDVWGEVASFEAWAPITQNATNLGNGTIIELPSAGYFTTESPQLHVKFRWRIDDASIEGIVAAADLRVRVVARASSGREYWTVESPLNATNVRGGDARVELGGVVDFAKIAEEVAQAAERFPPKGEQYAWSVVANVKFAGDAPFGRVRNASTFALALDYDPPIYVLPPDSATAFASDHAARDVAVSVEKPGLARSPWAIVGVLLGAAMVGLAWASRRSDPTILEGDEGAFHRELRGSEAWVTRVEGPLEMPEGRVIDVRSLADLASLASEARSRVVLDGELRIFYVFSSSATYRYQRHARALNEDWPEWLFGAPTAR